MVLHTRARLATRRYSHKEEALLSRFTHMVEPRHMAFYTPIFLFSPLRGEDHISIILNAD